MTPRTALSLAFALASAAALAAETPATEEAATDNPVTQAIADFRNGNHEAAIASARKLAEQENPDALFILGFASETGQGLPVSRADALAFYARAAQAGHHESGYRRALILLNSSDEAERQAGLSELESAAKEDPGTAGRILGEAYLRGSIGGQPDFAKTVEWWTRSAESGDAPADLLLARLYSGEFGFPDKVNPDTALTFIRAAAEKGNAAAFLPLGSRLLGSPDEKVRAEGLQWVQKAIDQGQTFGHYVLGEYQEKQLHDAATAASHYRTGAEAGQPDSMVALARLLLTGQGIAPNETEGMTWLKKAAEAGNPTAHLELAGRLGATEKPDQLAIYRHLLAASKANLPLAQNELGLLYLSEALGSPDPLAAAAWLTRAADAGLASAQNNLAALFERGVGVDKNLEKAAQLYTQAAGQGHAQATTGLARLHALGLGVPLDLARAWTLAQFAVDRGDEAATPLFKEIDQRISDEQRHAAKADYDRLRASATSKD
ncbi:hypothetical protein HNR46_003553 [Haloferula luteola]|uniref:Sel1 repeat family protein n=1 Tax=Haloferula luteola TaxID=595692 RepID=A0A840VF95_9BACT|nr:tetratricopeptide repeat protein [Haloferula luteola]MBB5353298.1 hypothetical protein [Haloferula luteola]